MLGLGLVTFSCHVAIGVVNGATPAVAASVLAGATVPPITAPTRALLARMLDGSRMAAAFDLEAALGSSAVVVGPLVIAIASLAGRLGPLVCCAGLFALVD